MYEVCTGWKRSWKKKFLLVFEARKPINTFTYKKRYKIDFLKKTACYKLKQD